MLERLGPTWEGPYKIVKIFRLGCHAPQPGLYGSWSRYGRWLARQGQLTLHPVVTCPHSFKMVINFSLSFHKNVIILKITKLNVLTEYTELCRGITT